MRRRAGVNRDVTIGVSAQGFVGMRSDVDLILWRHADAGDPVEDSRSDFDRRLTEKGRRQAARVAVWLNARLPERYVVLSSPAPRAHETAQALGRKVRTDERLAPGASGKAVLSAADWPLRPGSRVRHLVLVGHQPSLGLAASLALAGVEQPWTLRKSGLVWLRSRGAHQHSECLLRAVISADLI